MKTVITFLLTSSLSLFASPYWVQVSSIKSSENVSPSFLNKVKKSGFSHKVVKEDDRKRVCLGPFKSKKAVMNALPKIRCKIVYDAFIMGKHVIKPKLIVKNKAVKKELNVPEMMVLKPLPAVVPPKPCLCVYDAHLLHKIELDQAISYYKKSSYYSFKE